MYLNVQHTDRSRDCLKYCLTVIHFATTQNQPTPPDYYLQLPPCRHAFVSLREWSYFLVFKTNYSNFGWKKGITLLYSAPYCFARVLRHATTGLPSPHQAGLLMISALYYCPVVSLHSRGRHRP